MEEIKSMDFNEEISDRVDRFLRKEMDKEETRNFLAELKTNPELKDYYLCQSNLMLGIKMNKMRGVMKAKEEELQNKQMAKVIVVDFVGRYKKTISTIAVAAMMISGVFIWDGSVTKHVGDNMYSQVYRGSDSIDELVKEGKYTEALDEIDKELSYEEYYIDSDASNAYEQARNDLKYRKALIYLKMGKKHKAKRILKNINDPRSNDVLEELLW